MLLASINDNRVKKKKTKKINILISEWFKTFFEDDKSFIFLAQFQVKKASVEP